MVRDGDAEGAVEHRVQPAGGYVHDVARPLQEAHHSRSVLDRCLSCTFTACAATTTICRCNALCMAPKPWHVLEEPAI